MIRKLRKIQNDIDTQIQGAFVKQKRDISGELWCCPFCQHCVVNVCKLSFAQRSRKVACAKTCEKIRRYNENSKKQK